MRIVGKSLHQRQTARCDLSPEKPESKATTSGRPTKLLQNVRSPSISNRILFVEAKRPSLFEKTAGEFTVHPMAVNSSPFQYEKKTQS